MPVDPDLLVISGTFITLAGMGIFYSLVRKRLERRGASPQELRQVEERLERLEQAVDAIAIEVERVLEAQRFTAKVLADQRAPAELPAKTTRP